MSTSELFDSHKREECEEHTTRLMGAWLEKLTDRMLTHIKAAIEHMSAQTRRHTDTHEEVDYELRLRELEGQLSDRELRGVRMGDYHERGGKQTWKDWILGLVGLVILAWLGKIDLKMDKLTEVVVRTDAQEKELTELRCTVYKICQ
jgi:hypothetical protein